MTREKAKRLLPIIAAYAEGKSVQFFSTSKACWLDTDIPLFTDQAEYRVKPEPRIFDAVIDPDSSVMVVREFATVEELRDWTPIKLQEILD